MSEPAPTAIIEAITPPLRELVMSQLDAARSPEEECAIIDETRIEGCREIDGIYYGLIYTTYFWPGSVESQECVDFFAHDTLTNHTQLNS